MRVLIRLGLMKEMRIRCLLTISEGGIKTRIHKSLRKLEVKKSRIKDEQLSRST